MLSSALLFAFGATICWGIGDFLLQRSARAMGDIEALWWIGIIGTIGLLPFVYHDFSVLSTVTQFGLLLLLGIITFGAALFDLEALKIGKISVIDMVISLELPFTILLGIFFFHETLTIWQFIVIMFIMWGVSFIAVTQHKFQLTFERGVWLAIVAAIGMAITNFLTALSAQQITPLLAVWFPWLVFTVLCGIVLWKRGSMHLVIRHAQQHKVLIVLMGVFDTGAWVFYAQATAISAISITTAITESYPAIALFLGVWLNRERISKHQYVGAAIALVGSFILAII